MLINSKQNLFSKVVLIVMVFSVFNMCAAWICTSVNYILLRSRLVASVIHKCGTKFTESAAWLLIQLLRYVSSQLLNSKEERSGRTVDWPFMLCIHNGMLQVRLGESSIHKMKTTV